MPRVNEGPSQALGNASAHVAGLGLSPEGIQTNPVMYDLVADLAWTTNPVDLDSWVSGYAHRRYGVQLNDVEKAWNILQVSKIYIHIGDTVGVSERLFKKYHSKFAVVVPSISTIVETSRIMKREKGRGDNVYYHQ